MSNTIITNDAYITPRQASEILGVSYRKAIALIVSGIGIDFHNEKGRYRVCLASVRDALASNAQAIEEIKADTVKRYKQGLSVEFLMRNAAEKFKERNIFGHDPANVAEKAIYDYLMEA